MKTESLINLSKTISSGLTPLRTESSYWTKGTIKWLKTEQLGEKYIYDTKEKITQVALEETGIKIYPPNTISIAMYGEGKTRGSVSILKEKMATNQACCNLILDPQKANHEFIYYFLKIHYKQLRKLSSGVRKNLNSNDIKNFPVSLPNTLEEQEGIAKTLTLLDEKIITNNQINTLLEVAAKTIFDYWFIQYDFPDDYQKPYQSSGGLMFYDKILKREIPAGWNVCNLSDIANITMGQSPPGNSYNSEGHGVKFFQGSTDFGWRYPTTRQYTTHPGRIAKQGDILLSVRAPVGTLNIAVEECCVGRGLAAINSKEGFNGFLYYVLEYFKRTFDRYNKDGTTFGSITKANLYTLKLAYPTKDLLVEYDSIIRKYNQMILNNHLENQLLIKMRDWLLPLLMNGQVKSI